jgi:hypothetical protein
VTVGARLWRRGIGIAVGVIGLVTVVLGVGVYALFVFGVYHPLRSDEEACEIALPGPRDEHGAVPVATPGAFPISSRCRWAGRTDEIELVSTRTTVYPLVTVGVGLVLVVVGGVAFGRAGQRR